MAFIHLTVGKQTSWNWQKKRFKIGHYLTSGKLRRGLQGHNKSNFGKPQKGFQVIRIHQSVKIKLKYGKYPVDEAEAASSVYNLELTRKGKNT